MSTHGMVKEFNPSKEDWTAYAERLDHYFVANGVSDENKKRSILITVSGPAVYKLLKSLVGTDEVIKTKSFDNLVKTSKAHYDPKPSIIVERYKFNTQVRAAGESVAKYVAVLRSLAEHCHYGEGLNDMLRDRIVCGINHDKSQQRLLAEKNLTYAKAVELASAIEAAEQGSRHIKNQQSSGSTTGVHWQGHTGGKKKPGKKDGQGDDKPKVVCYCCGEDHLAPVCKFKTSKCHHCKKVGHTAKMCRSKPDAAGGRKPKTAHHLDQSHEEEEESTDSYYMFTIRKSSATAITEEVIINDRWKSTRVRHYPSSAAKLTTTSLNPSQWNLWKRQRSDSGPTLVSALTYWALQRSE